MARNDPNYEFIQVLRLTPSTTLDVLDRWVRRMSQHVGEIPSRHNVLVPEGRTAVLGPDFGVLSEGIQMKSSGNGNDCLIHSFLSGVSPSFRKLTLKTRNRIASDFRRIILPELDDFQNLPQYEEEDDNDDLEGETFLSDDIGERLSARFNIGILFVQRGNKKNQAFAESKNPHESASSIIIHGTRAHFTPVQINDEYIIPSDIAALSIEAVMRKLSENVVSLANVAPTKTRSKTAKNTKNKNNLQNAALAKQMASMNLNSQLLRNALRNAPRKTQKQTPNAKKLTTLKSAYTRAMKKFQEKNTPTFTALEQEALDYFS